jgi:hypothetical protein
MRWPKLLQETVERLEARVATDQYGADDGTIHFPLHATLSAPGGDFDLVTVRVVEIERIHGHEWVLSPTELESKIREPPALSIVVFRCDLESDVVERASACEWLFGRELSWDQHYLLGDARALRTDAQKLDRQLGRRKRLQPKRVTIKRHGSVDVLHDQHYLNQAADARHPL